MQTYPAARNGAAAARPGIRPWPPCCPRAAAGDPGSAPQLQRRVSLAGTDEALQGAPCSTRSECVLGSRQGQTPPPPQSREAAVQPL